MGTRTNKLYDALRHHRKEIRQRIRFHSAGFSDGALEALKTLRMELKELEKELAYIAEGFLITREQSIEIRKRFGLPLNEDVIPVEKDIITEWTFNSKKDRNRLLYDRYCVNCDHLLVKKDLGFECLNCLKKRPGVYKATGPFKLGVPEALNKTQGDLNSGSI